MKRRSKAVKESIRNEKLLKKVLDLPEWVFEDLYGEDYGKEGWIKHTMQEGTLNLGGQSFEEEMNQILTYYEENKESRI
jgi:hypothetical protein